MMRKFNESPPAPGFDRVMIPGQPEAECMQNRLHDGIPLSPSTVTDLSSLSKQFGVELDMDK